MISATVKAATGCTQTLAELYAPHLSDACVGFGITTPQRLAAFLAQVGHESGSLKYTSELWGPTPAQQGYEGRADLGNNQLGDGSLYRGHGLIQVTGRFNHCKARDRLRTKLGEQQVPDFERVPDALTSPQWAAWSAAEYWASHGCNELADAGDFEAITRRINGGLNGQADRIERWERAKLALGASDQPTTAERPKVVPTPSPPAPTEAPEPNKRKTAMPGILGSIVSAISVANPLVGLIAGMFEPLVQDKINKELERHTDNPAVKTAIEETMMQAAQAVTGKAEPLQAVAALQEQPELIKQVQVATMDKLDALAPLFDAMHKRELEMRAADIVSMDAAAARVKGDAFDMTPWLVGGALVSLAAIFGIVGFIVVYQVMATQDHTADTATWAALTGLIGFITGSMLASLYSYRFGTTRNSSANQAAMAELAKRGTPQQ